MPEPLAKKQKKMVETMESKKPMETMKIMDPNLPRMGSDTEFGSVESMAKKFSGNIKMSIKQMIIENKSECLKKLDSIREEYSFLIEVNETNEEIMKEIERDGEFLCPDDGGGVGGGGILKYQSGGGPDIPQEVQRTIVETGYDKAMVAAGQSGAEPPEPPVQLSNFLAKQKENYGIIVALSKKTGNYIYCSSKEIGNYIKDAVIVGMIVKHNVSLTVAIYYGSIIRFRKYLSLATEVYSVIPDVGVVSYITTISAGLTKLGYDMGAWAAGLVVGPPAVAKGVVVVCACILAYLVHRYLRKIQNVELSEEQKQVIQDTIDARDMNEMIKSATTYINAALKEKENEGKLQGTMADIEILLKQNKVIEALKLYLSHFRSTTEEDWPKALLAGKIMIYFNDLIRNMTLKQVKNIAGDLQTIFNLLFSEEYDGKTVTLDDRAQLLALEIPHLSAEMLKLSIAPYILMKVGHLGDIALKSAEKRASATTNTLMKNLGYGIKNFTDLANYLMPRGTIFISNSVWDKLGAMAGMMSSKLSAAASRLGAARPMLRGGGGSASRRRRKSSRRTSRKPRNKRKTIRKKVSKTKNRTRQRTLNKKSKKRSKKLKR